MAIRSQKLTHGEAGREMELVDKAGERIFPYVLLAIRLAMGYMFTRVGWLLLTQGGWDAWMDVGGYLPQVVQGPLAGIMEGMWGNAFAMGLLITGSLVVGLALILGLAVRLAALGGAVMMVCFYLATIPPDSGAINHYVLSILVLTVLSAAGAGHRWGIDRFLQRYEDNSAVVRFMLG